MKRKVMMCGLVRLGMLVLVFGMVIVGCATFARSNALMNGTETETSKMLLDAANEVLIPRESGWKYDEFKAAYERKVNGLSVSMAGISYVQLSLAYQGREYALSLDSVSRNTVEFLTFAHTCLDITEE